mmetsp:Transcript_30900/g.56606  ORF Transcript_30900/g.56606 Transcript_30900/m.56606 type:complete len:122 (-) Transcript_30900:26-391(-)
MSSPPATCDFNAAARVAFAFDGDATTMAEMVADGKKRRMLFSSFIYDRVLQINLGFFLIFILHWERHYFGHCVVYCTFSDRVPKCVLGYRRFYQMILSQTGLHRAMRTNRIHHPDIRPHTL